MKWVFRIFIFIFGLNVIFIKNLTCQEKNIRNLGIDIGIFSTGPFNAITDVEGVKVGHVTLYSGDSVRTGVTAILPHADTVFLHKVPAGIYVGNGFGKLTGVTQVEELGNMETPVILTNTLSVPTVADALIDYTLEMCDAYNVRSVNPLVGETNDGYLNDITGRHVKKYHVLEAIHKASGGPVQEGNVGAGTGTVCFGFKGGIGTSSRKLPESLGGYTVGVLVQTNFGGILQINGAPVGKELNTYYLSNKLNATPDGSCMIVVATDAPLDARNLQRLARRAMLGLAKTGGIASNGSGDYVIAFSTAIGLRVDYRPKTPLYHTGVLHNDDMSPLFMAVIEATEEAIIHSLFAAETMNGHNKSKAEALPVDKVMEILRKYRAVKSE